MRIILIIIYTIMLSSCASFYDVNVTKSQTYKQPDKLLDNFSLSGRFLIKNSSNSYYGNFSWWRESDTEELDLNSPIGTTIAQIKIKSNVTSLFVNGQSYTGSNLDDIMQKQLGFSLPLNYLYYWVQGFKLPDYQINNILPNGFTQLGWSVEYLTWGDNNLPQIIKCSKGDVIIKLVNNWN